MECGMSPESEVVVTDHGFKLIVLTNPYSEVEYFGVAVGAGSAMENTAEHGLAHFVEHNLFKGTKRHSSRYILNYLERLGGELNAYTNKEETVIYSVSPHGHIDKCMKLISDIITNSIFPPKEIEKERTVIFEEIESYNDTPADSIFDETDERLFFGSPLAHNILGNRKSIESFTSEQCREWLQKYYYRENSVVFYSGKESSGRILKKVTHFFNDFQHKNVEDFQCYNINNGEQYNSVIDLPHLHQCHATCSFRLPPLDNPYQYELLLLANILGGPTMNSRLNFSLREQRGLVYTVEASASFYRNAGSLIIYFGCEKNDLNLCRKLIDKELLAITASELNAKKLEEYKKQYLGQLTISWENREHVIMGAARSLLVLGKVLSFDEIKNRIDNISPRTLHEASQFIQPSKGCWLIMK